MLRRLLTSTRVRSLVSCRHYSSTLTWRASLDPLRILFCGADEFSIASLRALHQVKCESPKLIESIDVVHRPAKPTERGLKRMREVPIQQVATTELSLPTHTIDTFTGWTPPVPMNLVIAVSFGLFVPLRILGCAKYGGLNVHPSLLPDLCGPAPIEHALLKNRSYTGVSIQTLHPERFDQGTILAQTSEPGIPLPNDIEANTLRKQLAQAGAEMLVDVLKKGSFLGPQQDVGWYTACSGPINNAPKLTKQDSYIDFSIHALDSMLLTQRALGDLWTTLPSGQRLIIHKLTDSCRTGPRGRKSGIWVDDEYPFPLFCDKDGKIGVILSSTIAGGKAKSGNAQLMRMYQ